jgi:hypothetical protein
MSGSASASISGRSVSGVSMNRSELRGDLRPHRFRPPSRRSGAALVLVIPARTRPWRRLWQPSFAVASQPTICRDSGSVNRAMIDWRTEHHRDHHRKRTHAIQHCAPVQRPDRIDRQDSAARPVPRSARSSRGTPRRAAAGAPGRHARRAIRPTHRPPDPANAGSASMPLAICRKRIRRRLAAPPSRAALRYADTRRR